MKISAILPLALLCRYGFASEEVTKRTTTTSTCSLGIARQYNTISWDATLYNTAQSSRQDINIISTLRNTPMPLSSNITLVSLPLPALTITNLDNAVVFDYSSQDVNASITSLETGKTKVRLGFELGVDGEGGKWTTDNCTAGSVVVSAGRESWSCDFACVLGGTKREL